MKGDTRNKYYNINEIDENVHLNSVFYKEQIVPITNIDQRLVVTYSIKSRNYQRTIRQRQIDRAVKKQ